MSTIPDGGQAIPQPVAVGPSDDLYPAYPGMSLRDWFAGQALTGLLAEPQAEDGEPGLGLGRNYAANAAKAAYRMADAMLAARQGPRS